MSIKNRLTIVNFFQFFVWGAWLITIANYWFGTKGWNATQFGLIFSTMGIASLFMPTVTGIIADRWMNAEKLFGLLHLSYGIVLISLSRVQEPDSFFWVMLLAMCFYMPTIALNNSVSYIILKNNGLNVVKDFPPIRVFGTIGFIAAMWVTNLTGNKATEVQFYIGGLSAIALGIYAFTLPACEPLKDHQQKKNGWIQILGLDAFKLFKNYRMALFMVFSMLLGAALQLTNAYGDLFLDEFKFFPQYADSFLIKRSTLIMSISQVSETFFILTIPFFLRKFGIKMVMLMSMLAWVLRFGFFGLGSPEDWGIVLIIFSCIVYGMAFDFFNISGSIYTEISTTSDMRSSAQGLFMMMTNGIGAIFGSYTSGKIIDLFFTKHYTQITDLATYLHTTIDNSHLLQTLQDRGISVDAQGVLSSAMTIKDWPRIWLSFASYSLIVAISFAILFKYKHNSRLMEKTLSENG
ncbi:MAG: nucleoside permease [Chitinophagales bacterium]|nr:nucleoside permease [Chitinophagales bacterium]